MRMVQRKIAVFITLSVMCVANAVFGSGPAITDDDWGVVNSGEFPGTDGMVNAVALFRGTMYIGGSFTRIGNSTAQNIAKWDGSKWSGLGSGINIRVNALACDSVGNVYAGGYFDTAGGISAGNIARWNGNSWDAFGTGANREVTALVCDGNGNLYAGGMFDTIGGVKAYSIAKWNGISWSGLGEGMNRYSYVNVLVLGEHGNLYAGGTFDTAGNVATSLIAEWNGSNWSALGSGFRGSYFDNTHNRVTSLAIDKSGNVYAGGEFDSVGGIGSLNIAKWDGSKWSGLGGGLGHSSQGYNIYKNTVWAITCDTAGNVFAGGDFPNAGGNVPVGHMALWNGHYWNALGSGADSAGTVKSLSFDNKGKLIIGGKFYTFAAVRAYSIARWDGSVACAFGTGIDGDVYAIACGENGEAYIGGSFSTIGGLKASRIAKWTGNNWSALDTGIVGRVNCLAYAGEGNLYAGGQYFFPTAAMSTTVYYYLTKWDGAGWTPLGPSTEPMFMGGLYAFALKDTENLFACGVFVNDFVRHNCLRKWNGISWDSLGYGLEVPGGNNYPEVYALTLDRAGNLFAGGRFATAGHGAVRNIAKWDGNTWSALGQGINGTVYALACDSNGNLYAAGSFDTAGGVLAKNVARWDGARWDFLGTGLNKKVTSFVCDKNGNLYAGGYFDTAGGIAANRVARWDGRTWSSLGSGIADTTQRSGVNALALHDSTLYVGGSFDIAGNKPSSNIAKVNINGSGNGVISSRGSSIASARIRCKLINSTLYISNITRLDRINLYSLSGRCVRQAEGVSRMDLGGLSPGPVVVQIHREGKVVSRGMVMAK
jgi:hypothetical protein